MQVSRRDFVKALGVAAGGVVAGAGAAAAGGAKGLAAVKRKAMLFDSSLCKGCRACQNACKRWNKLPADPAGYGSLYDNPSDLSAKTWTLIKARRLGEGDGDGKLLCKYQCMHCTDAACVKVCPTSALTHHPFGLVSYEPGLCSGCGYCSDSCPFQVPRLRGSALTGRQAMEKCTFCENRVVKGQVPACVDACPAGALLYGDREDLVAEGRQRTRTLQQTYPAAFFYGERELGGLHVVYVLKEPPAAYAFPQDPKVPVTSTSAKDFVQALGIAMGGLTVVGLGLNYIVARAAKHSGSRVAAKRRQ